MIFPHKVIYTDNLPEGVGGRANGFIIRIRKSYKDDEFLLRHELEHVRQWYITLMLHPLLYKFSTRYRTWSEARAYARQVNGDLMVMAYRMTLPRYKLGISVQKAKKLILRYL